MSKYENIESLIVKSTRSTEKKMTEQQAPDYIDDDLLYISDVERMPEIYAEKLYANIICFCNAGSMEVQLGGERRVIEAGDVLVCPSNTMVERPMVSLDFKFTLVAFTDNLLSELLRQNMDVWNKAAYIRKGHVIRPSTDEQRQAQMMGGHHMMELLRLILDNYELAFRREMVCSVLQIVLLTYCSVQRGLEAAEAQHGAERKGHQLASTTIFNNFMTLLRQEKKKHRPVGYYADLLYITPKHLTFVCNQVSGRPATDLIQAAVTEEIIQYLRNPSYTVKQISEQMGFPNLSFFGKFVKKHLGLAPNDYRKRIAEV